MRSMKLRFLVVLHSAVILMEIAVSDIAISSGIICRGEHDCNRVFRTAVSSGFTYRRIYLRNPGFCGRCAYKGTIVLTHLV
jgi:hypothetical protein